MSVTDPFIIVRAYDPRGLMDPVEIIGRPGVPVMVPEGWLVTISPIPPELRLSIKARP